MRLTRFLPARLLGSPAFAAFGKRVFPRADLALQRATGGRASLTAAVGMPLLVLETTGRRSGELRRTPLTFAADGDAFIVIGSNWGQERQPGWALNLRANPDGVVELHGARIPVAARLLDEEGRAAVWPSLLEVWPAYDRYVERVQASSDRTMMVFRLERTT